MRIDAAIAEPQTIALDALMGVDEIAPFEAGTEIMMDKCGVVGNIWLWNELRTTARGNDRFGGR